MVFEDIKKYFGTGYRFKEATPYSGTIYGKWRDGDLITMENQYRLSWLTDGELVADTVEEYAKKQMHKWSKHPLKTLPSREYCKNCNRIARKKDAV